MVENNILKMKFKLNQVEFELEGNQEVVTKQFEDFKSFITQDLLPQMNASVYNEISIDRDKSEIQLIEFKETSPIEEIPIPSLKEIAMKDLPKTESDWLLIFCYYASNFGKNTFTKDNIKTLYEQTNRKNDSRMANLSNNIKYIVSKDYLGIYNDDNFLIKEAGINYVNEIIKGNSTSKSSTSNNNKKKPKEGNVINKKISKVAKSILLDRSLNLRPEGKESLRDFAIKYACDSTPQYITMIVYYLKEVLEVENVNLSAIYTSLEELNIRIPPTLNGVINNTKNRNGWLEYDSLDNISLSVKGQNAVKFDLLKKDN